MKVTILCILALASLALATPVPQDDGNPDSQAPTGVSGPVVDQPTSGSDNTQDRGKRQDSDDQSYNVAPDTNSPSEGDPSAPASDLVPPGPQNDFAQSRWRRQDDTTGSDGNNEGDDNNNGDDNDNGDGSNNGDTSNNSDSSDDEDQDRRSKRQVALVLGGGPYYGGGGRGGWGRGRPWRRYGGGGPWGYNPYRPYPSYYPGYYRS